MLPIIFLLFPLLLKLIQSCSMDNDILEKQTTFTEGECMCREYGELYVTCYEHFYCVQFPRTFRTKVKCFKLQATGITELSQEDFGHLTHITGLYIEAHGELVNIQPGTFKNLKNLTALAISYNPKLTRLDENVFEGLDNLETLSLIRNGFQHFKDFSLSLKTAYMPKLKTINLKELNCAVVGEDDFVNLNGSQVTSISFDDSQIRFMHQKALTPLRYLRNLSVSDTIMVHDNLIDVLEEIAELRIPLVSLSLNGWGFKIRVPERLFDVIAKSSIKELFLNNNMFRVIDEDTFTKLPNIESLYLEDNMLTDVRENAFLNLPKLRELHLKQNKLVSLPQGVFLPTIELLDVSENALLGTSYFTIEDIQLVNMPSLKTFDLSHNNFRRLLNVTLNGLIDLKTLKLYNCNIRYLHDYAFSELMNLEYLDLGQNTFPQRSFHKETFVGLSNLKYLSLENCKIENITSSDVFYYLTSLENLNLKNNYLLQLIPEMIIPLKSLRILNVDKNKITMWHERLFKDTKMEYLSISHNTLTYLTPAMLVDISVLTMIDISKNPFSCDCDHLMLIEFLDFLTQNELSHVVNLLNRVSTFCLIPEAEENTTIVNYYENNHTTCEKAKMTNFLKYLIPSVVFLIVFLCATIFAYIYRWHIRYWIFLTKLAIIQRNPFKGKENNLQGHTNYSYDAFVSYSSEDRNFVIRLVSMLENYEPYFRLCVYERDFEIGSVISENVLECLSKSRRTLLIISNSYIKSQWCTWEAQVAENHRLFFENEHGECVNDSLILIKLGNISSSNISPMLRYLMKTRVYLQWDSSDGKQRDFWEKLRNALMPALSCVEKKLADQIV